MSQQKLDSRRQQCRLFQKQKPLSAPGREWGTALRAGKSLFSTSSPKSEASIFLEISFPNWESEQIRLSINRRLMSRENMRELKREVP